MINPHTKFEVSTNASNEDMKATLNVQVVQLSLTKLHDALYHGKLAKF